MQSTGSWTVLRGRNSPIGLETKLGHRVCNTAVTFSISSHRKWCYAQKGSELTLCLITAIKLQCAASRLGVYLMPPMSSLKMVTQSFDSRSQRRRELHLSFVVKLGHHLKLAIFWRVYAYETSSLNMGQNRNLGSNKSCRLMSTHRAVISAVKSMRISWITRPLSSQRNTISVTNALDKRGVQ